MLWARRKDMTAKLSMKMNIAIPNQGDCRAAGSLVFESVLIRYACPLSGAPVGTAVQIKCSFNAVSESVKPRRAPLGPTQH
jgi:hypothetical protein